MNREARAPERRGGNGTTKVVGLLLRESPRGFAFATAFSVLGGAAASGLVHATTRGLQEPSLELGVVFAALVFVQLAIGTASHWVLMRLAARITAAMRMRLARAALSTDYARLERVGLGRIRTAIMEDAPMVGLVPGTLVQMIIAGATVVGAFGYLAWLSPAAAASTLVLAVGTGVLYRRLSRIGVGKMLAARQRRERLYEGFEGMIRGATEVRLHAKRRSAILADIESESRTFHSGLRRGIAYTYAAEAVGQAALFLGVAAAVATLAFFDTPSVAGVIVVVVFMQSPIVTLLAAGPTLTTAQTAAMQLEQLFGSLAGRGPGAPAPKEVPALPEASPDPRATLESVTLSGIRFDYPGADDGFGLGPVDLALRPGEIVFLTGGNGSGKTTLAKILVGLYAPTAGTIVLDGEPVVTDDDRRKYRSLFSVIYADGHVFPELWGIAKGSVDERATELLEQLKLAHKVEVKDGKLSTTSLSSGQRRRLALLAAWLEDRPIFVFDEWAADQDPEFKKVFYTKYLPDLKRAGKTAVVISHDDRYFGIADRVVQLERGRVLTKAAPSHPHEELPAVSA